MKPNRIYLFVLGLVGLVCLQSPIRAQQVINGSFENLKQALKYTRQPALVDSGMRASLNDGLFNYQYPTTWSFACGMFNRVDIREAVYAFSYKENQVFILPVLQNAVAIFYHADTASLTYNDGNTPLTGVIGHSSLKLALHYSIPLQPLQPYLLTFYDYAGDSIRAWWGPSFSKPYYQRMDSFVVATSLSDTLLGDTLMITHPVLNKWNKRTLQFIPTKAYTHLTMGNHSIETGISTANLVDNFKLYTIQGSSSQTHSVCNGDSTYITSSYISSHYEWSHSADTAQGVYIKTPGLYLCYAYPTDSTVFIDSIFMIGITTEHRQYDTLVCEDKVLTLGSPLANNVIWNTGATTPQIQASKSGMYWRKSDISTCTYIDSFMVQHQTHRSLNLPTDTLLCYGNSMVLAATYYPNTRYIWNTADTTFSITINEAGVYRLSINNGVCIDTAQTIVHSKSIGRLHLPTDTVLCFEEFKTLLLDAGSGYTKYNWQPTGEHTQSIYANYPERYIVFVEDSTGCTGSGSTLVDNSCTYNMYVPNAFTPNGDGVNDVFTAYSKSRQPVELTIYNSWGELIFTTNTISKGWDGTLNGTPAPAGVYIYNIQYQLNNQPVSHQNGTFTLLR